MPDCHDMIYGSNRILLVVAHYSYIVSRMPMWDCYYNISGLAVFFWWRLQYSYKIFRIPMWYCHDIMRDSNWILLVVVTLIIWNLQNAHVWLSRCHMCFELDTICVWKWISYEFRTRYHMFFELDIICVSNWISCVFRTGYHVSFELFVVL